jgi:hypothetical protein
VLQAEKSFEHRHLRFELVAGLSRVARTPDPEGEILTDVQGLPVVQVKCLLVGGQQRSELVPGPGRITRLPGPAGLGAAGTQGVRVLPAENALVDGQ